MRGKLRAARTLSVLEIFYNFKCNKNIKKLLKINKKYIICLGINKNICPNMNILVLINLSAILF